MKNVLQAFAFICMFCSPVTAAAQSLPRPALSVGAGTTGVGISYAAPLNKRWNVSGDISYLSVRGDYAFLVEKFPVSVSPNTRIGTLSGRLDFYPFALRRRADTTQRYGVRLSSGFAVRSNPTYEAQFRLTDRFDIGSFQLTDIQRGYVLTMITTARFQPFAGIGYDLPLSRYAGLGIDAGVFYHGKPRVEMIATGLLSDIAKNQAQIEKNLDPFRWYPYLRVKFNYVLR